MNDESVIRGYLHVESGWRTITVTGIPDDRAPFSGERWFDGGKAYRVITAKKLSQSGSYELQLKPIHVEGLSK